MENKRLIIAISLMLFIWSGYNLIFPKSNTEGKNEIVSVNKSDEKKKTPLVKTKKQTVQNKFESYKNKSKNIKEKIISIETDLYKIKLSTIGGRISDLYLKKFKQHVDSSELIHFIDDSVNKSGTLLTSGFGFNTDTPYSYNGNTGIVLKNNESNTIIFEKYVDGKFEILKKLQFDNTSYGIKTIVVIKNLSDETVSDQVSVHLVNSVSNKVKKSRYNFTGPVFYSKDSIHELSEKDIKKSEDVPAESNWISFTTKYFASIASFGSKSKSSTKISDINDTKQYDSVLTTEPITINSGESKIIEIKTYFGPRDFKYLNDIDKSFAKIIDLGFFGILAHPLLNALNFIYSFIGNYGISIILITLCIKLLFWPLTNKSYTSMGAMKKLQPEMQKLRTKYAKDKQKLNQEMMALYKKHRVNPFGGCFPMLIQIPVFFALYKVLLASIELRHAPFMLWINDLSAADTLFSDMFGLGFTLGPLPLIMGVTMFLQQKMTPTNMEPTQAKVMMFMPVFFTFIFLNFPTGLVLYWLINNILTITQQYLINKKIN